MRYSEHTTQPRLDLIPFGPFSQHNADAAGERGNLSHAKVAESVSEMTDQALFEEGAVSSLEGEFMIVNNGAACRRCDRHGVRGYGPEGDTRRCLGSGVAGSLFADTLLPMVSTLGIQDSVLHLWRPCSQYQQR